MCDRKVGEGGRGGKKGRRCVRCLEKEWVGMEGLIDPNELR